MSEATPLKDQIFFIDCFLDAKSDYPNAETIVAFNNQLMTMMGYKSGFIKVEHVETAFMKWEVDQVYQKYTYNADNAKLTMLNKCLCEFKLAVHKVCLEAKNQTLRNPLRSFGYLITIWINNCWEIRKKDPDTFEALSEISYKRCDEPFALIALFMLINFDDFLWKMEDDRTEFNQIGFELIKLVKLGFFNSKSQLLLSHELLNIIVMNFHKFHETMYGEMVKLIEQIVHLRWSDREHMLENVSSVYLALAILHESLETVPIQLTEVTYKIMSNFPNMMRHGISDAAFFVVFKGPEYFFQDRNAALKIALNTICHSKNEKRKIIASVHFMQWTDCWVDQNITLNYIVNFLVAKSGGSSRYSKLVIQAVFRYLPVLANLCHLLDILSVETHELRRVTLANIIRDSFNIMVESGKCYKEELSQFMFSCVKIIDRLDCPQSTQVLLNIFRRTNVEYIRTNFPDFASMLGSFVQFAKWRTIFYELGNNMVMDSLAEIMVRFSANYGKNDQMYLYIDTLAGNVLNIAQNYSKNKDPKVLDDYCFYMQVLTSVLKCNVKLPTNLVSLYGTRVEGLFVTLEHQSCEHLNCIDLYAIDTLLVLLKSKSFIKNFDKGFLQQLIPSLHTRFWKFYENPNRTLVSDTLIRISTFFACWMDLLLIFGMENPIYRIHITPNDYNVMVRTLQWFIFEQDFWVTAVNLPQLQNDSFYMNCETLWEIRYLMLDRFIDLHCDPALQLPVQRAWKLCLYYGWDEHLEDRLCILIKKIFFTYPCQYKSLLSMMIMNVFRKLRAPVENIIEAHVRLIDECFSSEDRERLKMETTMCVLEQIKTVYNVRPKDENDNRILPLLSLRTLLENVDLISGKYAVEFAERFEDIYALSEFSTYSEILMLLGIQEFYIKKLSSTNSSEKLPFEANPSQIKIFQKYVSEMINEGHKGSLKPKPDSQEKTLEIKMPNESKFLKSKLERAKDNAAFNPYNLNYNCFFNLSVKTILQHLSKHGQLLTKDYFLANSQQNMIGDK